MVTRAIMLPTVFGKYGTPPHLGWWVNPVRGFALTLAPSCGTQWSGAWKRKTLRAPTANSLLGLGTWSLHSPLKQQPLRGYVPTGKATHEAGTCEAWTGQPLATVEKARLPNVSFLLRRHIRNRLNPETICFIRCGLCCKELESDTTAFKTHSSQTGHRKGLNLELTLSWLQNPANPAGLSQNLDTQNTVNCDQFLRWTSGETSVSMLTRWCPIVSQTGFQLWQGFTIDIVYGRFIQLVHAVKRSQQR